MLIKLVIKREDGTSNEVYIPGGLIAGIDVEVDEENMVTGLEILTLDNAPRDWTWEDDEAQQAYDQLQKILFKNAASA